MIDVFDGRFLSTSYEVGVFGRAGRLALFTKSLWRLLMESLKITESPSYLVLSITCCRA